MDPTPLQDLIASQGWTELGRLRFTAEGGVDWSQRPFAKSWSLRRLGRAGLFELIAEHVSLRSECFVVVAGDHEGVSRATVQRALETLPRGDLEQNVWLVSERGRWLIELSTAGSFTFEFTNERDTKMLERLKAIENTWSQATIKPVIKLNVPGLREAFGGDETG